MGHYNAEMWTPLLDDKIRLDYEKRCVKEIDEILKKNKIKIKDIKKGDKLTLFDKLKKDSKVKVLKSDKYLTGKIIENLYTRGLYPSTHMIQELDDSFVKVYEIDYKEKKILIAPKKDPFRDPFPDVWANIKYFQKI